MSTHRNHIHLFLCVSNILFVIVLSFLSASGQNPTPKEDAEKDALKREQQAAEDIKNYLLTIYPAHISEVTAGQNKITVNGVYSGEGTYSLCEITPWQNATRSTVFAYKTPLTGSPFNLDFDRFVVREGIAYDRTLSKWMIVKDGKSKDEIVSHARYADNIYSAQTLEPGVLASKKGLAGSSAQKQQDFDDLQIKSTTVNIWIGRLIYSNAGTNKIEHQYGGRTWYFDRTKTEALDKNLRYCAQRNIVVAAIVLVDKVSNCPDIGKQLQHPDFTKGNYSMPNMTTPEATLIYAAALDFFANRYCRSDNQYGRIHHWIMHNEVDDSGWTNMGDNRAMMVYMDTYVKSMRLCYNIVRQYDSRAEVFGSFTRSWAAAKGTNYAARDMLDTLNLYSNAEGDFAWGLGYHPYPENIREPKTWLDANATYSMNTKMITFKNLEVLDKWVKQPKNKYKGTTKRSVWLSENGTNSKSYSDSDLREQAAGFAWTWKKINALDGIDAIQWHGWWDQPGEANGGVRIGLRTDNLEKKPVWFLFRAAGTSEEDTAFEPYKEVIGISDWRNIIQTF